MSWNDWEERCERPSELPMLADVIFVRLPDEHCSGWTVCKWEAIWRGLQIWRHAGWSALTHAQLADLFVAEFSQEWARKQVEQVAAIMRGEAKP